MRRFFLRLRVGFQDVAGPLPGLAPAVEFAADGLVGETRPGPAEEFLPQQGHGPIHRPVPASLRRGGQELPEQGPRRPGPGAGAARARRVVQGGGVVVAAVVRHPVVDGPSRHPQRPGHPGHGLPPVDAEDGEQAAVDAGLAGVPQLAPQALALCRSQLHTRIVHGLSPPREHHTRLGSTVQKLLRTCLATNHCSPPTWLDLSKAPIS